MNKVEMERFKRQQDRPFPTKKRSSSSIRKRDAETASDISNFDLPQKDKSAPYSSHQYTLQMRDLGSHAHKHPDGLGEKSKNLMETLKSCTHKLPLHTGFADNLYESTCDAIFGKNEQKVIRVIGNLITPLAETLAIEGANELRILGETIDDAWNKSEAFLGPIPQPDYAVGYKKDAFSLDQQDTLKQFIGGYNETSPCATTYDIYFPFFTAEVKCGAAALDIADRQNLHSQTVAVRALVELFRIVGREHDLHREIIGFSLSHNDQDVRVFGHYAFITPTTTKFYRHPISHFNFTASEHQSDNRWASYSICRNIYDWAVNTHFPQISKVVDMIIRSMHPTSQGEGSLESNASGLSQALQKSNLTTGESIEDDERPVTPHRAPPPVGVTQSPGGKVVKKKKHSQNEQ
jgi:hypothetical protein